MKAYMESSSTKMNNPTTSLIRLVKNTGKKTNKAQDGTQFAEFTAINCFAQKVKHV
jgi:hypothetical protein